VEVAFIPTFSDRHWCYVCFKQAHPNAQSNGCGDRAIELSIALETLLGDRDPTEMAYRIRLRSARLLGGPDAEREKNIALIKAAYSIRSIMVHRGRVETNKIKPIGDTKLNPSQIIDAAIALCAAIIKKFICRGSIPDWQAFDRAEHCDEDERIDPTDTPVTSA
jgi:hypothetical protein